MAISNIIAAVVAKVAAATGAENVYDRRIVEADLRNLGRLTQAEDGGKYLHWWEVVVTAIPKRRYVAAGQCAKLYRVAITGVYGVRDLSPATEIEGTPSGTEIIALADAVISAFVSDLTLGGLTEPMGGAEDDEGMIGIPELTESTIIEVGTMLAHKVDLTVTLRDATYEEASA